jgi:hypothetical protein
MSNVTRSPVSVPRGRGARINGRVRKFEPARQGRKSYRDEAAPGCPDSGAHRSDCACCDIYSGTKPRDGGPDDGATGYCVGEYGGCRCARFRRYSTSC